MSGQNIGLGNIVEKTGKAKSITTQKVREIQDVTSQLRILALNALIEAKRAGDVGRGFSVVADEVKSISSQVEQLSKTLSTELGQEINELEALTRSMNEQTKGNRFVDLSLNAVELIDRNLYERTCDVRWWATDSALVNAANSNNIDECNFASKRLGVILDAYTVYIDLWLCNLDGEIIANGRPENYNIIGRNISQTKWFQNALKLHSGNDYIAGEITTEPLLKNAQIATYASGVRENGDAKGRLLGILGVHFDWQPQANAIVNGIRLSDDEIENCEVCLIDKNGLILSSSKRNANLTDIIRIKNNGENSGYYYDGNGDFIAFHQTPGYETYEGLGWFGLIKMKSKK